MAGGPPGSPDEDGDRFVEIWNLVFMQFEQLEPGKRVELPRPSIDTGDIDLMRAIIEASAEASEQDPDGPFKVSHRVIADHLRASAFLIADGVLPSNEGRGYVLRRIMRRAMRHAHKLGCKEPMVWRLVPALTTMMGQAYPELRRAEALVSETLRLEEGRFKETLDRGLKLLEDETGKLGEGRDLDGEFAFKLYDTFGFPLDLTQDILRGQGRGVDTAGFETAMERQATEFLGYQTENAEGTIVALVRAGEPVERASSGDEVEVLVNQTPFYGESGGQMGDTGTIVTAAGAEVLVSDTQKRLGALHAHMGTVSRGEIALGDMVELWVDGARRTDLRAHHSATHLLHEALRRHLGEHVTQKGSLVAPDRLRFDFSHPKALDREDLLAIEADVNRQIRGNDAVLTRFMTPEEAVEEGALALFGEKYGEEVRVVSMGGEEPLKGGGHYSTELCGGTHVARAGDIGFFKIVGEGALAAGVRRIEAVCGRAALHYVEEQERLLHDAAAALKAAPGDLPVRVAQLVEERRKLERDNTDLRHRLATGEAADGAQVRQVDGVNFAARLLRDVPPKDLKPMADELKKQVGSGVVALVASNDGKASLVVAVTDDLTARYDAVQLVRAGSQALGGSGGGGRPDMAQAGGPDGASAEKAIEAIESLLADG
jgi:alanyl-tRNA synthetase